MGGRRRQTLSLHLVTNHFVNLLDLRIFLGIIQSSLTRFAHGLFRLAQELPKLSQLLSKLVVDSFLLLIGKFFAFVSILEVLILHLKIRCFVLKT